jgi:NADPH:quinone reductase-like Zn-dependent oxidoreductase
VRAAVLRRHGEPPSIAEIGEPEARDPGEVVLDMISAAVNPLDRLVSQGKVAPDAPVPRILGVEGTGRAGSHRYVVAEGRLDLAVGCRFPLAEAAAAFAALQSRKPGKILLDIQA